MKKYLILLFFIPVVLMGQNCPSGKERVKSIQIDFEKEVLRLTNNERSKNGLKPLIWDETLAYSARYHAKDMAIDNYFDHDSYDRKGNKLVMVCETFSRIGAFINYGYMAENISAGRTSPEDVVKGWMKSSGHRKNILKSTVTRLGVGYYYSEGSEYGHYWVQNFGGE